MKKLVFLVLLLASGAFLYHQQGDGKLLSAFAGGAGDSVPALDNGALLQAIARVEQEQSLAARDALYAALNQASYLLPLRESGQDEASRNAFLARMDGQQYLTIYSDAQQLGLSKLSPAEVVEIDAASVWTIVLGSEHLAGAILNPAGNAIPIDKDRIREIGRH